MTRERKEELVALALAVSLALHAFVMFYAKPKVMTNVARGFARVVHREPMRVAVTGPMPESALIERPAEADAVKDAPAARDMEFSAAPEPTSETPAADGKALAAVSAPELSGPEEAPASFDISPPDLGPKPVSAAIPVVEIRAPAPEMAAPPAGSGTEALKPPASPAADFSQAAFSAGGVDPDSLFAPAVLGRRADDRSAESPAGEAGEKKPEFKPAEEVFETVDEKAVEREREAVKSLLEADGAEELERFADAQLVAAGDGEWTYFKVMISPRSSLPVVPKDAVVLIDASGSIGRDRMASVRPAAKKLLRSLTNTGDRFNLVAFRDRYQYAFRRWQECSRTSFDRAERWIDNLAAHGRTDVFATIRSVLTLPRDPGRPLVALVVTDGDANSGVSETAEIISRFTALNDGLVSLYMYGVKDEANRELMDALTRGNRGEYFVYSGRRTRSGSGIEGLAERFRDPVLSDIRVVFSALTRAEAYPRRLRNLYKGGTIEIYARVPAGERKVAFSLRGLNGSKAYEGFFSFDLGAAPADSTVIAGWKRERDVDLKLK